MADAPASASGWDDDAGWDDDDDLDLTEADQPAGAVEEVADATAAEAEAVRERLHRFRTMQAEARALRQELENDRRVRRKILAPPKEDHAPPKEDEKTSPSTAAKEEEKAPTESNTVGAEAGAVPVPTEGANMEA